MRYDNLLIDVVNVAYRTFTHKSEQAAIVGKKQVYKDSIANFIRKIEELKKELLHFDGHIYLLFDNPTSRIDLQSSFYFADSKKAFAKYKEDRSKEPKEFYNSLNLIKYYYLMTGLEYHTIQIQKLEADDLVEPTLKRYCKGKQNLLVSTDLDWARYISNDTHWQSQWGIIDTPETISERLGFPVNEQSLTAYKAIFGDPSDNIPPITTSKHKPYFLPLLSDSFQALQLIGEALTTREEPHPILDAIRQHERQYRINLQLVESIPVGDSHIEKVCTTGRGVERILNALEVVLGLKEESQGFVFGNIKRPRI
jgi:hypothetical protein